jgi:hypothetical protein
MTIICALDGVLRLDRILFLIQTVIILFLLELFTFTFDLLHLGQTCYVQIYINIHVILELVLRFSRLCDILA